MKDRKNYQHLKYLERKLIREAKRIERLKNKQCEELRLEIKDPNITFIEYEINKLADRICQISCFSPEFSIILSEMDVLLYKLENALKSN